MFFVCYGLITTQENQFAFLCFKIISAHMVTQFFSLFQLLPNIRLQGCLYSEQHMENGQLDYAIYNINFP